MTNPAAKAFYEKAIGSNSIPDKVDLKRFIRQMQP
ncbi:Uncharacterised protein [Legionella hackeliae]|nr:Uncharacterised protein [Legionella hackeliae]